MHQDDMKKQLARLQPRRPPGDLRRSVLARLDELNAPQSDHFPLRPQGTMDFETVANWAVAVLILIAAGTWSLNLHVHSQRLDSLLGPSMAERRAEKMVRMLALAEDDPGRLAIQTHLRQHFHRIDKQRNQRTPLHSLTQQTRNPHAKEKQNEVETTLEDRAHRRRESSHYRRGAQLENSGTA